MVLKQNIISLGEHSFGERLSFGDFEELKEPPKDSFIDMKQLESRFSDETVDCMSWEPVVVLEHNKQALVEAEIAPTGLQGEDSEDRKKSFAKVYANNEWGNELKSGPGSLLENSWIAIKTLNIVVEKIKNVLGKEKIRFLDSSCGDMTWMPTFLSNRTDIEFTGYDIVEANIENHKKKFKNTDWKFEVHDSVVDTIPQFDLILTRHTMMHLKLKDGAAMLRNFYNSGTHFLLATNFPEIKGNNDLPTDRLYRYQMNNLHLPPYNLPPPVCQAKGDAEVPTCYIAFWELDRMGAIFDRN